MKLEFSGSPEIAAARELVWQRLMDPQFVARSAPGVELTEQFWADFARRVAEK